MDIASNLECSGVLYFRSLQDPEDCLADQITPDDGLASRNRMD